MGVRLVAVVALSAAAACSGGKSKGAEDARRKQTEPLAQRDDGGAPAVAMTGHGDVQIRVEWKDAPTAVRSSPGRTACGTARAAQVSPTTTWGIPDVFVTIDAPGTIDRPPPRIVLEGCALSPRVALAGTKLTIASGVEAPAKLALAHVSQLPFGGGAAGTSRSVYLPIAGHEVEAVLEPKSEYALQVENPDGKGFDLENSWIVSTDSPFYGITDASGQAVLRDVPAGVHAVTAWLPPRASQDARLARGTVTVNPGGLAEVTVDLAKP